MFLESRFGSRKPLLRILEDPFEKKALANAGSQTSNVDCSAPMGPIPVKFCTDVGGRNR
jgi:hypothetical protein